MKIRLLSDLHTEFRLPYKTADFAEYRGEDVLVLAGDIASGSTNTMSVIKFFKEQGFPHIVYVAGNHEYYGGDFVQFNEKMAEKCSMIDGVHFLNPGSVTIDGVLLQAARCGLTLLIISLVKVLLNAVLTIFVLSRVLTLISVHKLTTNTLTLSSRPMNSEAIRKL